MREYFWQKKPWQAFKNTALIFSFLVNLVLIIVLLLILPQILPLVNGAVKPLVGGLHQSFVEMNQASITRTIIVDDVVPINLDIPISASTMVTLTQDVVLGNYPITLILPGGGGQISGNVTLVLPTGLELPVQLGLHVSVEDQIPINLGVDIDIPLNETQLGTPFTRLENLFGPLVDQLDQLPESNDAALELILPQ